MNLKGLLKDSILETERLTVRRLTPADASDVFAVFSDPKVMRFWSSPPLREVQGAEAMVARIIEGYESGQFYQFGLGLRPSDQILGTCTLHQIDVQNRRAELGYALGRPYWGQGLMGEALRAFVSFCFDDLELHRLEADTDPRNLSSVRILERLGFQREGLLRERWIVDGEVSDTAFYGLLASEWRK